MNRNLTLARLALAVLSTTLEEAAIWVVWRWLLPEFDINIPISALIVIMIGWAAFSTWLFILTTRALKRQAAVGLPSMVGAVGKAASRLAPEGLVKIRGELWGAMAEGRNIEPGEEIVVEKERGLKLYVRGATKR
ncbi:MAG: hypothetical protein A2Y92_02180 [Chloroflexi bacterium RBG_13_57_8]|nr:MAG: hypothetical protein A2Y92_02180 [Chloroflexi bacterium RBG_13_57_8]